MPASSSSGPLEPGTLVGEYRVEGLLGAGAFGDVYAGEQPLIGKRVAIKVLHPKFSADEEVLSRFIAEARAVNKIRHRNIIDIFSFGQLEDGRHYFIMEHLDGLTLKDLLEQQGRLGISRALPILAGVADALDAAHDRGITHRDVKPANIFLERDKGGGFFPKLLDFGVAKLRGEEHGHQTQTGVAIGTPRYMSPEQCRSKPVDHRSDIYSLGVVAHEVLTGKALFEAESHFELMAKHAGEQPPAMSSVCAKVAPILESPVLKMLAKRAKHRPDTAAEAIEALAQCASTVSDHDVSDAPSAPTTSSEADTLQATPPVADEDSTAVLGRARFASDSHDTAAESEGATPQPQQPASTLGGTSRAMHVVLSPGRAAAIAGAVVLALTVVVGVMASREDNPAPLESGADVVANAVSGAATTATTAPTPEAPISPTAASSVVSNAVPAAATTPSAALPRPRHPIAPKPTATVKTQKHHGDLSRPKEFDR